MESLNFNASCTTNMFCQPDALILCCLKERKNLHVFLGSYRHTRSHLKNAVLNWYNGFFLCQMFLELQCLRYYSLRHGVISSDRT